VLRDYLQALEVSEMRYRTLFDSIDEGFCVIEMIFDQNGKPTDYIFRETNPSFEKQTGLVNVQGKRIRELVPKRRTLVRDICTGCFDGRAGPFSETCRTTVPLV
jgi:PAS domain-containing protein